MALLLERGTVKGVSSIDLAHAAGISLRTFHRYLGGKEDCVRPVLYAAIAAMGRALTARPASEPLNTALGAAFAAAASGQQLERTLRLIPLLTETPAMRAVWAQSLHDGETALTLCIAERMGLAPLSTRAPPSSPPWCSPWCAAPSSTRSPRAPTPHRSSTST
ncbi:hypothetical protein Q0F99_00780 [Rathayibacter oskolensis]|uniref:TetR/AcrR family transcriptional regulator n=1 Tax=Rathayibacter oskolensis TaxID=1891671 RepID=UPI00265E16B6|nr:hypothetical protein [Rathayibacter oskolensis]WKK71771.1 hypothetical protein Q0F99_00780 [Rathayibacter oskolensis]